MITRRGFVSRTAGMLACFIGLKSSKPHVEAMPSDQVGESTSEYVGNGVYRVTVTFKDGTALSWKKRCCWKPCVSSRINLSKAKPTNWAHFLPGKVKPTNEGVRRDVIELKLISRGNPGTVETLTITIGEVSYEDIENGKCRIAITSRQESLIGWRMVRKVINV